MRSGREKSYGTVAEFHWCAVDVLTESQFFAWDGPLECPKPGFTLILQNVFQWCHFLFACCSSFSALQLSLFYLSKLVLERLLGRVELALSYLAFHFSLRRDFFSEKYSSDDLCDLLQIVRDKAVQHRSPMNGPPPSESRIGISCLPQRDQSSQSGEETKRVSSIESRKLESFRGDGSIHSMSLEGSFSTGTTSLPYQSASRRMASR